MSHMVSNSVYIIKIPEFFPFSLMQKEKDSNLHLKVITGYISSYLDELKFRINRD